MRRPHAPSLPPFAWLRRGRIGPEEAAAYDEAARNAFSAGRTLEPPKPRGSASTTVSQSPMPNAAPGAAWVSATPSSAGAPRVARALALPAPAAMDVENMPELTPTEAEAAKLSGARQRREANTAPDFLLQAPSNTTALADDFFDGLIARVEGDR